MRVFPKIDDEGFTLVEVMVALMVFTIGVLAVFSMQITATKGNFNSASITEATTWASGRVEQLIVSDYTSLVDTNGDGLAGLDMDTVATADGNIMSPDNKYQILWNVAVDQLISGTKLVRVFVIRNVGGMQRTVVLTYNMPEII